MTTAFSVLQSKLDYFLDDEFQAGQSRRFPLPVRIHGWNWAQRFFVNHTPLQKSLVLNINEGGRTADLPNDFFSVKGLYDSEEEYWWSKLEIQAGGYREIDSDSAQYWIWNDVINLERQLLEDSEDLKLYYWAYYPDLEFTIGDDDEDITYTQGDVYTPKWAEVALMHLTTAFCWHPGSVLASDINQWRINVDSGTPMHNPRAAAAVSSLWWYNELVNKVHPADWR